METGINLRPWRDALRKVLAGRIQTGLWGNTGAMEVTPTTERITGQDKPRTRPAMAIKPPCVSSPRRSEQGQPLKRLPWPGV